jgi:hypothetical protein
LVPLRTTDTTSVADTARDFQLIGMREKLLSIILCDPLFGESTDRAQRL